MNTEPAAQQAERTAPPAARRIPHERTFHGDTFTDDYAWLADPGDPQTIAFLEAENAYTEAVTAGQAGLRDAIFGEIKARTQETDLSVPARKGGWWYYARTVESKQYPVYCRRAVRPDDAGPPMSQDGAPLDGEEVLLDGNELAAGQKFFSVGAFSVSPDGRLLAYSTDFTGGERFTLRVKDLVTGETAADEIPDTFYGAAWSLDGSALFYVTVDEAWRPYRVWRHTIGRPASEDGIVYEEADEKFWVGVWLARSERYVFLSTESKLTSEAWLLDAARPDGEFRVVMPRQTGAEYGVAFAEPVYTVAPGDNREYETRLFRLGYTSLVTPESVYDCDMTTGELILRKRRAVLPLPGGTRYDPGDYEQHREWATAADGMRIPISLVCRKGTPRDGSSPFLLYGYGSYEISVDPSFDIRRLSLLDRDFGYAIAHVRGGGEMGRRWYDDGKMLHKINTFTDFVACAEHLVTQGWTAPSRLIARGGSAGGLLMGAVANIAPQDFGGIVAHVPFVDALTTILDPTLPLTVTEWEEWGDPLHDPQVYAYMKSYSPYENVTGKAYPPILAVTSLNDTRVLYSEPAKWIARLQAAGQGGPFLLKTQMVAGHGGRSGRYDAWHEEALVLAWIVTTAGAAGPTRPGS